MSRCGKRRVERGDNPRAANAPASSWVKGSRCSIMLEQCAGRGGGGEAIASGRGGAVRLISPASS